MGIVQAFHCDCCEVEMPSSSVLDCVIVTLMEQGGNVVQHYYGIACGCAGALNAAVEVFTADHASHEPVAEEPPAEEPPAEEPGE